MQPFNGPFQGQVTQKINACVRVCHLNIEGISTTKSEVLSKLMKEEKVDVIALQETHSIDEADLHKRGQIAGYTLIGAVHHKQYGVATYLKSYISNSRTVAQEVVGEVFILTTNVSGVNIVNVYKPPNTLWNNPPLRVLEHPTMYIGDFNSHSQHWGYNKSDENGELLFHWLSTNNMELVYSTKDKGTFHSARWNKDYSPDLGIISKASINDNTMCSRKVLDDFPHSQHRPVLLEYGLQIPTVRSIPKSRWHFKKAN